MIVPVVVMVFCCMCMFVVMLSCVGVVVLASMMINLEIM
jgi:hypothetical protein